MEGRPYETNGHDPARLRISDDDRHQVAEVLRHAAGEGRLDLTELDERLEATYQARTYGDLVPITADLPGTARGLPTVPAPAHPAHPATPATAYPSSIAVLGDCRRRGSWRVPEQHTAFALTGSVDVDLREVVFEARETTVTAVAILGSVDVVVNPETQVVVDGVGVLGDFRQARDRVPAEIMAGSPVVRVRGLALLGSVTVRRKPLPTRSRRERPR